MLLNRTLPNPSKNHLYTGESHTTSRQRPKLLDYDFKDFAGQKQSAPHPVYAHDLISHGGTTEEPETTRGKLSPHPRTSTSPQTS